MTAETPAETPPEKPAETVEVRRKRLTFRSWHRGTREADILLGRFADRHLPNFDEGQLERYERLLELSDPDLYNWMSAREPVPPEHDNDVMRLLVAFNFKSTVA
jgi:antitoxin CptB